MGGERGKSRGSGGAGVGEQEWGSRSGGAGVGEMEWGRRSGGEGVGEKELGRDSVLNELLRSVGLKMPCGSASPVTGAVPVCCCGGGLSLLRRHHRCKHLEKWMDQRFGEGVGGGWGVGGWQLTWPKLQQKKPLKFPQELCPLSPKGCVGKRVQKRGLNPWHKKDLLAPTSLVRQPLLRNFRMKRWISTGNHMVAVHENIWGNKLSELFGSGSNPNTLFSTF